MKKKSPHKGFTLIELVVVMMLLGIMIGITGIRLNTFKMDVKQAAIQLENHLALVKEKALHSMHQVGLVFHPDTKSYESETVYVSLHRKDPFYGEPLNHTLNIDSLSVINGNPSIFFDGRGRPVDRQGKPYQNAIVIKLQSGSQIAHVIIEPMTGYIYH